MKKFKHNDYVKIILGGYPKYSWHRNNPKKIFYGKITSYEKGLAFVEILNGDGNSSINKNWCYSTECLRKLTEKERQGLEDLIMIEEL